MLWEPLGEDGRQHPPARPSHHPSGRGRGGPSSARPSPWATPPNGWRRVRVASCCSSPARPVRARPRWWPRRPGPPTRTGPACCSGTARRTWPPPISSSPRPSGTTSPTRPRTSCVAHVAAHGSELSRLVPALASRIPDLPPVEGHRHRHRAVPALRRRGGPAGHGVGAAAGGPRPRRPPVGRQGQPAAAAPPDGGRPGHAGARPRDLPRQRAVAGPCARATPWGCCDGRPACPASSWPASTTTGVVSFVEAAAGQTLDDAGVDLAHAVYRETDGNPFFVSEVLRHLPRPGPSTGTPAADGWPRTRWSEMALPDSVREVIGGRVGRLGPRCRAGAVDGRGHRPGLRPRRAGPGHRDHRGRAARHPRRGRGRGPGARAARHPGRYNFAHALIQHTLYEDLGPDPPGPGPPPGGRGPGGAVRGPARVERVGELARHWFSATQPIDLTKAIGYSRQAGDAALAALAPADALRYYAQALDLYAQARRPRPGPRVSTWPSGWAPPSARPGTPPIRETLLGPPAGRPTSATPNGWWPPPWPTTAASSAPPASSTPRRWRSWNWPSPGSRRDDPERALVLATLCAELAYGSPLERRQALADEAVAIADASGDDAIMVRVLNLVSYPLSAAAAARAFVPVDRRRPDPGRAPR